MAIANGYATLAEIKTFVSWGSGADFDADLERAVEAASRMIDQYCGRVFYDTGTATAKTFVADHAYELDVPDFHTTTGLVVATDTTGDGVFDTTWAATDYQVEPVDPTPGWPWRTVVAIDRYTFPTGVRRARSQVTARWGWVAVPKDVAHTCLIVASELWRRKDAPFGLVGEGSRIAATEYPILARLDGYLRPRIGSVG